MQVLFNDASKKDQRRQLRNNATKTEQILWSKLKGKQLGEKFRRQVGIGPYIVDFYCPARRIVVEIDGDSHGTPNAEAYDDERSQFFAMNAISTIRFTNKEIYDNLDGVIGTILDVLGKK